MTLADALQGHRVSGEAIDKLLEGAPTADADRSQSIETAGANQVVDHADVVGVSRLVAAELGKADGRR